VSTRESPSDVLPHHARKWASTHRATLELIADTFLRDAQWPACSQLQRRVVKEMAEPVALSPLLFSMPKPLGFVNFPDERIVLTMFGLRQTETGSCLVEAVFQMLRLAIKRYQEDDTRCCVVLTYRTSDSAGLRNALSAKSS
jgi:hypothetical protein